MNGVGENLGENERSSTGYEIVDNQYEGVVPSEDVKQVNQEILNTLRRMIGSQLEKDKLFLNEGGKLKLKPGYAGHVDPRIVKDFVGERVDKVNPYGTFVNHNSPVTIDETTGKLQYNLSVVDVSNIFEEEEETPLLGENEEVDILDLGKIPTELLPAKTNDSLHNEYSSKTGGANKQIEESLSDRLRADRGRPSREELIDRTEEEEEEEEL